MVAMVIGMLGLIIMMQVFSAAEGQRRATTGSGDAQSNGAMALYALQRDIRQGGYGFNAVNAFGCPLALPAPASRTLAQLAPVIINPPTADVPAGDANTDTLLIAYGNNEGPPEGDVITASTACNSRSRRRQITERVRRESGHRCAVGPHSGLHASPWRRLLPSWRPTSRSATRAARSMAARCSTSAPTRDSSPTPFVAAT
jgi:hypothetical protein